MRHRFSLSFFLSLFLSSGCAVVVFDRFLDVPGQFFFIQDAIDFAHFGDTVRINCGVYSPSRTGEFFPIFLRNGVKLKGGSANCVVIDAQNTGSVLDVSNYTQGEISGITFRNGLAVNGGGLFLTNVTDTLIRNNVFESNRADNRGSALWMANSDNVRFENNLFNGNSRSSSATLTLASVQISDSGFSFFNNVITSGDGDGLTLENGATGTIENNIFFDNGSASEGFGFVDTSVSSTSKIAFNLFFQNAQGSFQLNGVAKTAAEANDLSGDDMIFENREGDPLFANAPVGDFHLVAGSPAIDAGDPDPAFNDATNGTRNDLGVFGGRNPLF